MASTTASTSQTTFAPNAGGTRNVCTKRKRRLKRSHRTQENPETFPKRFALHGPDDFIGLAASKNPLSIVAVDETGPYYIQDGKGGYETTHVLVCVEIISYRVYLIPLPRLDTATFVRALEILQATRGRFTTLILDDHSTHRPLEQASQPDEIARKRRTMLEGVMERGHTSLLAKAEIKIVIASSKRHEKLGRAEFLVKKVKYWLGSILKTWVFGDNFDFLHKMSLVGNYLNERPVFYTSQGILTPYTVEEAMMKRSTDKPKLLTFSEFAVPTDKQMYKKILELSKFSRQILFEVATAAAIHLLNKRTLNQRYRKGDLVYLPDRLLRKHPNSLRDALGKISSCTREGRDYQIEMLDGEIVRRHFSDLSPAAITQNQAEVSIIDPFLTIDYRSRIIPENLYPHFDVGIQNFKSNVHQEDRGHQEQGDVDEGHLDPDGVDQRVVHKTGQERVEEALKTNSLEDTDAIIRKMMQKTNLDDVNVPTNLQNVKRPRSYNKKKRKLDAERMGVDVHNEPMRKSPPAKVTKPNTTNIVPGPDTEESTYEEAEQNKRKAESNYDNAEPGTSNAKPRLSNEDLKEAETEIEFEEIKTDSRRSKRIPKMSAKALQAAELEDYGWLTDNK